MARITLDINDASQRLTLAAMLQADGHVIVEHDGIITIADTPAAAVAAAPASRTLLLTPVSGVPDAIAAMREGVYGYILLPLQPDEANLMVARALSHRMPSPDSLAEKDPADITLAEAEKQHIEKVLRACKGNQVKAARRLGIGRNTLWRKMKAWRQK